MFIMFVGFLALTSTKQTATFSSGRPENRNNYTVKAGKLHFKDSGLYCRFRRCYTFHLMRFYFLALQ